MYIHVDSMMLWQLLRLPVMCRYYKCRQYGSRVYLSCAGPVGPTVAGYTCHVQDGLESKAEAADFQAVLLLEAVLKHAYSRPVIITEHRVVVAVKRRSLSDDTQPTLPSHRPTLMSNNSSTHADYMYL